MSYNNIINEYITQFVENNHISEQSDICKHLKEKGYNIPQATISRRLHKLKIAKIAGIYKLTESKNINIPTILDIKPSDSFLIVIHTYPAQANALAYILDKAYVFSNSEDDRDLKILGTIAGDDTVLVITKNLEAQQKTLKILETIRKASS